MPISLFLWMWRHSSPSTFFARVHANVSNCVCHLYLQSVAQCCNETNNCQRSNTNALVYVMPKFMHFIQNVVRCLRNKAWIILKLNVKIIPLGYHWGCFTHASKFFGFVSWIRCFEKLLCFNKLLQTIIIKVSFDVKNSRNFLFLSYKKLQ